MNIVRDIFIIFCFVTLINIIKKGENKERIFGFICGIAYGLLLLSSVLVYFVE